VIDFNNVGEPFPTRNGHTAPAVRPVLVPAPTAPAPSADTACEHTTARLPKLPPDVEKLMNYTADDDTRVVTMTRLTKACVEADLDRDQTCAVVHQAPATASLVESIGSPTTCVYVDKVYRRDKAYRRKVDAETANLRAREEARERVAAERAGAGVQLRDRLLTRSELANIPALNPLISDTLELGTLGMLAGPYGSCKSFVALSWAASISTGTPWFGREVSQHGPVIYVAGEGASGINGRLSAWEADTGADIADANLLVLPMPVNFGRATEVAEFCEIVAEHKPVLVILETLNRCAVGMDENSAQEMGRVVNGMYEIQRQTAGGSVFVVHHAGKDGTIRGSTSLAAGMDTIYTTKGGAQAVGLSRTKRKDGEATDELSLRLRQVAESAVLDLVRTPDMATSNDERLLSAFVSAFSAIGCTRSDLRKITDFAPASFSRSLNKLVSTGSLINKGTAKAPFYQLGTDPA
jgi:hypothetical protein